MAQRYINQGRVDVAGEGSGRGAGEQGGTPESAGDWNFPSTPLTHPNLLHEPGWCYINLYVASLSCVSLQKQPKKYAT